MDISTSHSPEHGALFDLGSLYAQLGALEDKRHAKGDTKGVHLLAAYLPKEGIVLMQMAVDQKENEISAAPSLLQTIDLRNKVVRADAMLTQRRLSALVLDAGGDYLWVVKENQPQMLADIREVFDPAPAGPAWSHVPRDLRRAQTIDSGHGRFRNVA